MNKNKN